MATKTTAAKSKVPKSTAVIPWEDQLALEAENSSAAVPLSGGLQRVTIDNCQMEVGKQSVSGNVLRAVVVDGMPENGYYDTPYVMGQTSVPACYAYGTPYSQLTRADVVAGRTARTGMKPHEKAVRPQHKDCATCPFNAFGSAEKGRGKACGNRERLQLIPADALASVDLVEGVTPVYLSTSPTNGPAWGKYMNDLKELHRISPLGALTEIGCKVNPKTNKPMFTFKFLGKVDAKVGPALMNKRKSLASELISPYPPPNEEAAKPVAKKRKTNY